VTITPIGRRPVHRIVILFPAAGTRKAKCKSNVEHGEPDRPWNPTRTQMRSETPTAESCAAD
jgi:hypothetical protein